MAEENAMPNTVTIDGQQYDLDTLSETARNQLFNLRVTDQELQRLNHQMSIAKTARVAYANALKRELGTAAETTAH